VLRRRCGKGFSYLDPSGRTLRDKGVRARIKALAIPPAWTDVRIAHDGSAHVQATGRDAEGRLQYRYHPEWEHVRSTGKERRLLRFGSALPRVRNAVKAALAGSGVTRTKVIAAVVRLIDVALLRPGYEEYAGERGGRGAATKPSRSNSPPSILATPGISKGTHYATMFDTRLPC
jgi:DNA topoisomerase-1